MRALGRLMAVELADLTSRRFLPAAAAILMAAPPLAAWLGSALDRPDPDGFRTTHTLGLFAAGARVGLFLATYLAVAHAAMSVAREFDHGTIKNLLTRPVRRRDVFAAKALTSAGLLVFFQALGLWSALLYGALAGDLGHVWAADRHVVQVPQAELEADAWRAVGVAFPAGLAGVAIALAISTLTESSGWAAASALTVMILLELAAAFPAGRAYSFFAYPDYAFDVLGGLSRGSSAMTWEPSLLSGYLARPLAVAATALGLAAPVFCFKDVEA